jgi:hypothetical protein
MIDAAEQSLAAIRERDQARTRHAHHPTESLTELVAEISESK